MDNHEQNAYFVYRKTLNDAVEHFEGVNKDLEVQQETVKDQLANSEAMYAAEKAECNNIAKDLLGLQEMNEVTKKKLKDADGAIVIKDLTRIISVIHRNPTMQQAISTLKKYNMKVNYFKFTLDKKGWDGLLDFNIKTEDHGSKDHSSEDHEEGNISASANVCASKNLAYQLFGGNGMLWGNVTRPEADAIRQQMNKSYCANNTSKVKSCRICCILLRIPGNSEVSRFPMTERFLSSKNVALLPSTLVWFLLMPSI